MLSHKFNMKELHGIDTQSELLDLHFDKVASAYVGSFSAKVIKKLELRSLLSFLPTKLDGKLILDIGCGSGYYIRELLKLNPEGITGVDRSHSMINQVPSDDRVKTICGDFASTERDGFYDLILILGVLEFCQDPQIFLKNISLWSDRLTQVILLYPPDTLASRIYQTYHRSHGIQVNTSLSRQIDDWSRSENWTLAKKHRIHPFAQIESYVRDK